MRVKTGRFLLVLLVALLPGAIPELPGQDRPEEERQDVFAPFVSRLRVAVRDPQIRLTWRDSVDLEGGSYRVYRHTREITRETFPEAELVATVSPGVETYLDTPLEMGRYFYAIVATDEDDTVFPIFVPFRNKTINPVTVTRLETEEDLAARVYDLEAQPQEDAIVLRFNTSRGGRRLAVYRSTLPYTEIASPRDVTLLDTIDSSTRRFVDYAVPGVEYYYGLFDVALVERGTFQAEPGANVLPEPVQIPLRVSREDRVTLPRRTARPAPLPILEISGAIQDSKSMVARTVPHGGQAQPVRPATARSIESLLRGAPRTPSFTPEPLILPPERSGEGQGAARTLAQVLNTYFIVEDFSTTVDLLHNLLELPLSRDFERRVRFYLGQALWFEGHHQQAFMEFLFASEGALYSETRPWIAGILERG
ncbi:MAG: hypothetical protein EA427_13770 [Spirochaetaceae bacterium]|nr:MAG: hypothetical protein EA427_13770 [Spirochaetaceae bacterium]